MKKTILLFSLIILTGFRVFAQTLSLEQARTLALANSRSLAKYNMAIKSSVLDEKYQLYSMLPSLSAEYSATMSYLNKDWGFDNPIDTLNAKATFSITQIIFQGGKGFVQKAIRSIATESVRKEALAEYFNVLDAADNAYYAALEAAATLEAEESSLQTALVSFSIAEVRLTTGMINQGDYLKALADKETRENYRNQARRNLSLCIAKLKSITGIKETFELEPVDFDAYEAVIQRLAGISDENVDALYDEFIKILATTNPSLARAALNSKMAEKNLSLVKRDIAPTISATIFSTGLNYSTVGGFSTPTSGGGITIMGSIPIDFWVTTNRIAKSRITADSAALDYISAESQLETELQSALLNAFAQAEAVLSSRRSVEYIERNFEFVMERYRLSQSSISDLNEASTMLINSRNNLIKARYGFLQSLSKLRSLGAFSDEEKLIDILMGNF